VEYSRTARRVLEDAGADVLYREYPLAHALDPAFVAEVRDWLGRL
jgi:predicted esterase